MDLVRVVLEVLNGQDDVVTMRHIAYRTGFAPSTLVGIMMSMINQGYISEVHQAGQPGDKGISRCTCACCKKKSDLGNSSSLDRRTYRINQKGKIYLINWTNACQKNLTQSRDGTGNR